MTQEGRVHRVRVLRRALNAWLRVPGTLLGWLRVVSGSINKIAGARAAGDGAWITTQTQAAQTAPTNMHAAEQAELQDRQDVQTAFNQHHTVAPSVEGFVPSAADIAVLTQELVDLGYSLLSGLFSSLTPSEGKWPLGSTDDAAIAAGNNVAPSFLSTVCRDGC